MVKFSQENAVSEGLFSLAGEKKTKGLEIRVRYIEVKYRRVPVSTGI